MNQYFDDEDVTLVAGANTDFCFRLLNELTTDQPSSNVFFSPYSISNALAMTLNGTGGQTRRDMAWPLGLGAVGIEHVNRGNSLLRLMLTRPDLKVNVVVANALWANRGITFATDFLEVCRRSYEARTETLDFASPSAVVVINEWVSQNTHGKITHLVAHSDISAATAVLTNAIYFHGKWQTPFDKAATQNAPFMLENGNTKNVAMMRRGATLAYRETARFQAVSLDYGDGRMSLYVVLPKTGHPVDGLVADLSTQAWADQLAAMRPTNLVLFLPRFKAECKARLREPLSSLGMASAFDIGANFRPMGLNDSFINDVIHEAMVEVDEEGTVAAAATAVVMVRGASPSPIFMRVDHPFFCAIRDNTTGTLLFAGVIRDPE